MTLFEKINLDLQAALKSKDELRLSILRMMKSKILYVNARGDLKEDELIKIVSKYAKELKETIEEMQRLGRPDAAEQSVKELKVVEGYLPKQLSEDEIKNLVKATAAELNASSIKDMGNLMKAVLAKAPGIDGKIVSQLVREILK
ncbi:hypothetical protein A2276_02590 [candidate division WOR-1 bacterium RIFOXYA12_FULL_43_27]|uniref:Glutamyl-tRNA amidotransferase n=1 Tax=candidate division WOR-1 bacterium RIFOXYC2_FULL_46_14 TaxID=1802587 RepID=A0A1F4U7X5_UNCSA|nr:MAG: hypothetical protein A2276_02590 [candidate division WOR-1 bacterium RIFOXYA12_FULL_43_27]OGC19400.1 MAG: hypothetical protein A2292_01740 [candidate division WOR-1 bacterium RIFOXYB2_FULL_46_45]OGC30389.1 MAG: hypothetical protein A2232_01740 [candidate division WOR-1 bacterium RIFOXYA2_FULL_46_56]OGC40989.1 MAG: hypothetical protein A2438_01740 [candidate division WOR-1 bacterium RIFOXYC2_FULL_46_14]